MRAVAVIPQWGRLAPVRWIVSLNHFYFQRFSFGIPLVKIQATNPGIPISFIFLMQDGVDLEPLMNAN